MVPSDQEQCRGCKYRLWSVLLPLSKPVPSQMSASEAKRAAGFYRSPAAPHCSARSKLIVGLAACLFAFSTACSFGCGQSPAPPPPEEKKVVTESEWRVSDTRLPTQHSFALLRTRYEVLPAARRQTVRRALGSGGPELSFFRAQVSRTPYGRIWWLEGASVSCLFYGKAGGISCNQTSKVVDEGITLGVWWPRGNTSSNVREHVIFGIVPDYAKAVSLRVGNHLRRVDVHANSFSAKSLQPLFMRKLVPFR